MIKKYMIILFITLLVWNINSLASADPVTDPTGDDIGSIDLTSAEAEVYTMPDGQQRLKLSIETTSNIPGLVLFECDVDNSTGTGGTLSMTGIPVAPGPCKTSAGFDVALFILTRNQGDASQIAFCAGCTDAMAGPCGEGRKAGQWYVVPSYSNAAGDAGELIGLLDPTPWAPGSGKNSDSYSFPWTRILVEVHQALKTTPTENFQMAKAIDPANNRWQVSIWHDPSFLDQDDMADGTTYFNISDWLPNGNGVKAVMQTGDALTFCEGDFDNDADVDAMDLIILKSDFGRGTLVNTCPRCK